MNTKPPYSHIARASREERRRRGPWLPSRTRWAAAAACSSRLVFQIEQHGTTTQALVTLATAPLTNLGVFGNMFSSKRERPTGGKKRTWTRPFARPRPSSTADEGGSVVPNSRLITAVIWISRTPMGDAGPLGSTQTTTTATAMRQKTRPPRNQTRAEWEMEWKARRG